MKLKSLFTAVLATSCVCAASFALANEALIIDNRTNLPSTTVANSGPCSAGMDATHGVTQPGQVNVVPPDLINKACARNKENCDAKVYMNSTCTPPHVYRVVFSTTTGIKSITPEGNPPFVISGSGFNVIISNK